MSALKQEEILPYISDNFTDIKTIKQQIIKGSRYFKIQVDSVSEQACKKFGDKEQFQEFNIHYDVPVTCLGIFG